MKTDTGEKKIGTKKTQTKRRGGENGAEREMRAERLITSHPWLWTQTLLGSYETNPRLPVLCPMLVQRIS